MKHDIVAYRADVDSNALRDEWNLDDSDSGWLQRFAEFEKQATVASLGLPGDLPVIQSLYRALGVFDYAYAGATGAGVEVCVSREQFQHAHQAFSEAGNDSRRPDRHMGDAGDQATVLYQGADTAVYQDAETATVVERAIAARVHDFVRKCLCHLDEVRQDELVIYFG